ncbi:GDP-mannose 4,6-dehydratase [Methanobacterium sp. MZ-A1]|uniref:GDP-mannose 4,6-dehydratase n=1 Tax=Methanobacterium subterraneum TaxID=59277 RepID=A0A2H4VEE3_9EURY|nr:MULTISPECIES: GDP-mannose 4,6-dehydratase [Methanobacterium]AUB56468.1 GDP-mannose 4,6-dehydratase [Methanobacterium subterraneum]AUB58662.1 GDP-mannose 4,6-dehydratase [Methanobacterium sp. MZ-A1]MBW4257355.1 GDP-mannose 4,6-dehydratase [Methanobacterium sp. YSL]
MNWKDKNVLITGIGGFAGSYLAKELVSREANVYGLIRRRADGTTAKNIIDRRISNEVNLIEGDLIDITSLTNALDHSQPDYIFHLAAQSFVERSFDNSQETQNINCIGTSNLLEAVRIKDSDTKIVFAGSSEEYGLVLSSQEQYEKAKKDYGTIFPEPEVIPEVPITETNPLRPMSPYAVSKVYGDYLMRNYYHSYGLDTVVSRAFNHEGAGRGIMFVTSVVTNQIMKLKSGESDRIVIGNLNSLRDWSHVKDIVQGYLLLAEKGQAGEVYNQGSMRTNSVLSYILLGLEEAGWDVNRIETFKGDKQIQDPNEMDNSSIYGVKFPKTKVDQLILEGQLEYTLEDKGIKVNTTHGDVTIEFNPDRFRPAEVPILFADTKKIQAIGGKIDYTLNDILKDQLNYFLKKENRSA